MVKRFVFFATMFFVLSGIAAPGLKSATFFERPPNEKPDVLSYGWRGLFLGALTGLSAGYVRYAEKDNAEIFKSLAYGTVVGAGVGLVAGLNDASLGYRSTGDILLRDMTLGGWFGVVVGSVWGGVDAINSGELSALGRGASWGYIFGVVTGLGIGIYESVQGYGAPPSTPTAEPARTYSKKERVAPYVTFFEDSEGNSCPAVAFTSRF